MAANCRLNGFPGAVKSFAEARQNDLEPYLVKFFPTFNKRWPLIDLKLRLRTYFVIRSQSYGGAKPFKHLNVSKRILKAMRPSESAFWSGIEGYMWRVRVICRGSKKNKNNKSIIK